MTTAELPRPVPHGPAGTKRGGQSMQAWIKAHPGQVAGGAGIVLVIAYALYKRHQASAAGTGTSSTGTTTGTTAGLPGTYDSTANDVYNSLESQLGALSGQIASLSPPAQGTGGSTGTSTGGGTAKSPTRPAGPYSFENTNQNIHSVPQIAHHYGLSSAEVLAYNPQFQANGWNVHGLPYGVQYYIPSIKTAAPAKKSGAHKVTPG